MTAPYFPATDDARLGWGTGYCAGHDTGYQQGLTEGRRIGFQAGREQLAGELLVALRFGFAGVDLETAPIGRILEVLATPMRDLVIGHQRACDQLDRRREWDAAANLPRPGDRKPLRVVPAADERAA